MTTAIYYRKGNAKNMKASQQKIISLPEIIHTLETKPLFDARSELYKSFNASLSLSGTVLKVVKRSGFKFYLQVDTAPSTRKMEAYAEFEETEIEKAQNLKIRKGSKVSLIGRFQTCGESAMVLYGCRFNGQIGHLKKEEKVTKVNIKKEQKKC